jgi:hypothetical protein
VSGYHDAEVSFRLGGIVGVSEQEFAEWASKLQYLSDRQEILDCVNRYCRGLDRLDADLIRSAFHPDGIDDHGAFVGDVDEFVPWAIECEAPFKLTHHRVSGHSCDIDGDIAHAESYVMFTVVFPDKPVVGVGAGRYIDKLERRHGHWGITVRRFVMDWTYEAPQTDWLGAEWSASQPKRDRTDLAYQRPLEAPAQ